MTSSNKSWPFQALLVVDVQHGFIEHAPDKALPGRIKGLVTAFASDSVYYTQFHNHAESLYVKVQNWGRFFDTQDTALAPELAPLASRTYKKYGYLLPERLLADLKKHETVGICGVNTDICVLSAAYGLWDAGIRPVILADYCASVKGTAMHQAGLAVMQRAFGVHCQLYGDYTKW
jgi:nicotinamidase-related amidase